MASVNVTFKVSVRLDIDVDRAAEITRDDVIEMAHSSVNSHHAGNGTQLIIDGKCQWRVPYRRGGEAMKPEEAEFVDYYVECPDPEEDAEIEADEEFSKIDK